MKSWLAAIGLATALVLATPVAAEEPSEPEGPGALARDGVERLMRALEAFIDMIPQYEMPEINEDGDIIIRRKRDVAPGPQDDEEKEPDQTQT
jgi:hypothetical protein